MKVRATTGVTASPRWKARAFTVVVVVSSSGSAQRLEASSGSLPSSVTRSSNSGDDAARATASRCTKMSAAAVNAGAA